ncbi:hypothetical protein GCM10022268_31370 [Sphingomonas cynarae]|uniref:Ice-binding protein C-terminal domain-containing protein n=1 Tax=Sphingomonas cynarae TaxID=930197 RepID=A0ABP7ERH9_9SPHN
MKKFGLAALAATATIASSPAQAGRYLIVDISAIGTGNGANGSRTGSQPTLFYNFTTFYASFAYNLGGFAPPSVSDQGIWFAGQIFDRQETGHSTANGFDVKARYSSHFVNYDITGSACFANATPAAIPTGSFGTDPACSAITVNYGDGFAVDGYSFKGAIQGIAFREIEADTLPNLTFAIPEPASWALMLTGFGLTGYALRRRRPRIAFAG